MEIKPQCFSLNWFHTIFRIRACIVVFSQVEQVLPLEICHEKSTMQAIYPKR